MRVRLRFGPRVFSIKCSIDILIACSIDILIECSIDILIECSIELWIECSFCILGLSVRLAFGIGCSIESWDSVFELKCGIVASCCSRVNL